MTGRALVEQLLNKGQKVRAIVRSPRKLPAKVLDHPNATVVEASVLDLTDEEMAEHVKDCDAVVSCLGEFSGSLLFDDVSGLLNKKTATPRLLGSAMFREFSPGLAPRPRRPPRSTGD